LDFIIDVAIFDVKRTGKKVQRPRKENCVVFGVGENTFLKRGSIVSPPEENIVCTHKELVS